MTTNFQTRLTWIQKMFRQISDLLWIWPTTKENPKRWRLQLEEQPQSTRTFCFQNNYFAFTQGETLQTLVKSLRKKWQDTYSHFFVRFIKTGSEWTKLTQNNSSNNKKLMVIRNKLLNKTMILLGRKSTNRSKIVAKGCCQYLDIFSDIAHHHVIRITKGNLIALLNVILQLDFSMFRLNIVHKKTTIWGHVRIVSAECFVLFQNKAIHYPIRDSVQIQASGNSCRTLLTGATASGVPVSGLPAVAVGEGLRPPACPRTVKPESSASASANTPQRTKPQVGQLT